MIFPLAHLTDGNLIVLLSEITDELISRDDSRFYHGFMVDNTTKQELYLCDAIEQIGYKIGAKGRDIADGLQAKEASPV